jgi:hypothetical protein
MSDGFYKRLTVGTNIHYFNGFNTFVRCKVTIPEEGEFKGKKALQPIALVGEWSDIDLPKRNRFGKIEYPYWVRSIRSQTGAFRPNVTVIYESKYFSGTTNLNPKLCATIDWMNFVPSMTPQERQLAKEWEAFQYISNMFTEYTGDIPLNQLYKVQRILNEKLREIKG